MSQSPAIISRFRINYRVLGMVVVPLFALTIAIISANYGIVIALALSLSAATGIAIFFRNDLATYLFIALIYSNAPAVAVKFYGVPKLAASAVVGLLVFPLIFHLLIRRQPIFIAKAVPWIFLFIVIQIIASLNAGRMHVSMPVIFTSLIEGLLIYGLITNVVRSPHVLRNAVWTLLAAGTALGLLSFIQSATNTFDRNYGGFAQVSTIERNGEKIVSPNPRSVGPIGEKNYYAQFMSFLVPLGLITAKTSRSQWARMAGWFATGLILLAITFTASRGAAIGLLIMLVSLATLRIFTLRQVILMGGVTVALVLSSDGFRERISDLVHATQVFRSGGDVRIVDKSVQGRASEMAAALVIFSEHPILGVGAGNFPYHFSQRADVLGFQVHDEERMAHCSYLEIAAETGILGLICFLAVFLITTVNLARSTRISACRECRNMATAFLLTVIIMMTTSFFLSFAFIRYYWLILALAACAAHFGQSCRGSDFHSEVSA